jgi:inorganic pyrophosphatase
LESTLHALMLDQKQNGQRLLRTVAPIRKKAGEVRDMDLLTGFAATLPNDSEECLTQLLEHLGAKRLQSARRLRAAVAQKRKKARRRLRRYSGLMRRNASRKSEPNNPGWPVDATAIALQLSSQLAAWPRLNSTNLHPYRLKVKELRYVLQLAEGQDSELVDALGEVKDAIGEWHDWSELAALAKQILNHGSGCKVLQQIRETAAAKFDHALSVAETMRKKFLGASSGRNAGRRTGPIKLSKVMPEGMMFPYDFGFLPNTKSEDGDPLDVLILSDEPTFPGCQIDCRLIGVIKANQKERGKETRNDRLIAVAAASVLYAGVEDIADLEPVVLKQVEDFFVNYQKVRDIEFKILARDGWASAQKLIEAAAARRAA